MSVWSRWRERRNCWHHNHATGETWITGQLIDFGRRKMWSCRECGRRWVPDGVCVVSADLLRRAAKALREHAEAATPGPWEHVDYSDPEGQPLTSDGRKSTFMGCGSVITMADRLMGGDIAGPSGDCYPRSGYWPKGDMAYIALMHPPVALILAEWLEVQAIFIEQRSARGLGVERGAGPVHHANAVARAILRSAP